MIRPALTPEEWEDIARHGYVRIIRGDPSNRFTARIVAGGTKPGLGVQDDWGEASSAESPEELAAVAAIALHGQPFGFTWSDVTVLEAVRDATRWNAADTANEAKAAKMREIADHVDSILRRLAALLPPRVAPASHDG